LSSGLALSFFLHVDDNFCHIFVYTILFELYELMLIVIATRVCVCTLNLMTRENF